MGHLHRFYIPGVIIAPDTFIQLPDEEAHHALRVVRLREGEEIAFFDGQGNGGRGDLRVTGKHAAAVAVTSITRQPPPLAHVIVAPAWLHRDKPVEEILRRCTELGVSGFAFWRAERSQKPPADRDKWQRILIESCKQCGRNTLPNIFFYSSLSSFLSVFNGFLIVASESAKEPLIKLSANSDYALVAGPEGDFSGEERQMLAEHRAQEIYLGGSTLRTEVATIALATLTLNALGMLGTQLRQM